MPYVLRPLPDDTFEVINKVSGESVAKYTSHSKAVKHIRRLYSDESKGKVHPWLDTRNRSTS